MPVNARKRHGVPTDQGRVWSLSPNEREYVRYQIWLRSLVHVGSQGPIVWPPYRPAPPARPVQPGLRSASREFLQLTAQPWPGATRADVEQLRRELWAEMRPPAYTRPTRAQRPRCGAKTRVGGTCRAPALWHAGDPAPRNGRCRMHGGLSTGPRTPEGRQRCAEAAKSAAAARLAARRRADQARRLDVRHEQLPMAR